MKKIVSLIIAFTLIISFAPLSYAENNEFINSDLHDRFGLIEKLGILDSDFISKDKFVTRAEFAKIIIKSSGISDYIGDYKESFKDVTRDTLNAKEIGVAKEMGLIGGYTDNTYRPDNNISAIESAISFIRLLGYDKKADAMGGYPEGYNKVIRETGIFLNLKNIKGNITNYDMVQLIYNALHTKVLEEKSFGKETVSFESKDGYTLLYKAFSIECVEGVVKGVDITNLVGENDLPDYCVYIDDKVYYSGQFPMNEMLGYHVRAYYKFEREKNRIKFALKDKKKNDEKIINIKDIDNIQSYNITYVSDKDKLNKINYKKGAPLIFNGASTKVPFNMDILKDESGKILNGNMKLLDNNNDGKSDVIFIEAYDEITVGWKNKVTGEVYDNYSQNKKYILSTDLIDPYVIIYDEDLKEMSFDNLKKDDCLMIYKSKPDAYQQFIRAYKSSETTEGTINEIWSENSNHYALINDKEYKVSDYIFKNNIPMLIGKTVVFNLNHKGEIVNVSYDNEMGAYEISLLCATKKPKEFEDSFIIKLYTTDKQFINLYVADKLTLDGNKYKTTDSKDIDKILKVFEKAAKETSGNQEGNYYFTLIKYGLNEDGKINYIDTLLDADGSKMAGYKSGVNNELYMSEVTGGYYYTTGMVGDKVIVENSAKTIIYPDYAHASDEGNYGVKKVAEFFHNSEKYKNLKFFRDSYGSFSSKYFIKQYEDEPLKGDDSSIHLSVISNITESIDDEGANCYKLYYHFDGQDKESLIYKDTKSADGKGTTAKDLGKGDIIYCKEDGMKGEISTFCLCYDFSKKENCMEYKTTSNQLLEAVVLHAGTKGVQCLTKEKYDEILNEGKNPLESDEWFIFNNTVNKITVIDKNAKASTGSYDDIVGYDVNSDNPSIVFFQQYGKQYDTLRQLFVYE